MPVGLTLGRPRAVCHAPGRAAAPGLGVSAVGRGVGRGWAGEGATDSGVWVLTADSLATGDWRLVTGDRSLSGGS